MVAFILNVTAELQMKCLIPEHGTGNVTCIVSFHSRKCCKICDRLFLIVTPLTDVLSPVSLIPISSS